MKIGLQHTHTHNMKIIATFCSFVEAKQARNTVAFFSEIFTGEIWGHFQHGNFHWGWNVGTIVQFTLGNAISWEHICAARPPYSLMVIFVQEAFDTALQSIPTLEWGISLSQMQSCWSRLHGMTMFSLCMVLSQHIIVCIYRRCPEGWVVGVSICWHRKGWARATSLVV